MSDFDQFFKDRLDEEQEFPYREKNWGHLSKRLDAFHLGTSGSHLLHHLYWKAAAALLLLTTAALFWKMNAVQHEIVALQREIQQIKASPPNIGKETTGPDASATSANIVRPAASPEKEKKTGSDLHRPERILTSPADGNIRPMHLKKQQEKLFSRQPIDQNPTLQSASIQSESVTPSQNAAPTEPNIPTPESRKQAEQTVAMIEFIIHHLSFIKPPSSTLELPRAFASPQPLIKPVHDVSHFRIGIHALAGGPATSQAAISTIIGQGIHAAYTPLRNLGIFGSLDFNRFDINATEFTPKLPFEQPMPEHGHPQTALAKIEGTQRQQLLSLGVRYAVPLHFWLHPAFRVAHTWTHFSSCLISNRFEDEDMSHNPPHMPSDPEYKIVHTDPKSFGNIWRFGAGLEHETSRWVFSIWTDYLKNGNTAMAGFDNLIVETGISYKFK